MPKQLKLDVVFGGFGPSILTGSDRRDVIFGGFGDESIDGRGGDDLIFGGFGDDTILGAAGNDRIFGGFGTDTAVFEGGVDNYTVSVKHGRHFSPVQATVTDANGDTDKLHGIEKLYFAADDYTADLTGQNNAVLARDDAAAATADTAAILSGLTANDFDFDGDTLTVSAIDTSALIGSATLNDDGTVSYDAGGAFDYLTEGETAETTLTYTVTDGRGSSDTATVTITVTGVNDAPTLALADATIFENSTPVLVAAAVDADGDTLTYSIGGTDAALFVIDPSTGALSFTDGPDFESPADADGDNVYNLSVTATDTGGLSATSDIAVTVADVDENTVFLNEIHYDNAGSDNGEFVELAGVAGTNLTGWSLALYNGNNGMVYDTIALSGSLVGSSEGYLAIATPGIQNGGNDGIALVNAQGQLVEFLSYEGTLTALDGPALGVTSTDIGVSEPSNTPVGFSLQRQDDGTWAEAKPATPGTDNTPPVNAFINEFHYDNAGADAGEFIEIAGTAGADLTGWSLVLYNGNNGASYDTIALTGALSGSDGTGYLSVDATGLQNGDKDGIALVNAVGEVVEFLSYEGTLTAIGGPADGLTSTDVMVSEPGSTPVGQSLQRNTDGTWSGPLTATRDAANTPVAPGVDVQISELAVSTTGTDWEFLELSGTAGTSLDGLQLVQIGATGDVLSTVDLTGGVIGESGFYLAASTQAETTFGVAGDQSLANNTFANVSSSFLLVQGAGTLAGDLDADDDGTLDAPLTVVDGVALTAGDSPLLYTDAVVGPDGSYLPAGAERQTDGSFAMTSFADSTTYSPTAGAIAPPPPPPPVGTSLISTIQGDGAATTLAGATVTVEAVVTAVVSNGFYLQEEDSDADGNAATSEGIFVYTGGAPSVALLDVVSTTGVVSEFFDFTEITADTYTVLGTVMDLPTAAEISLPFTADINLEAVEGMRVTVVTEPGDAPLTVIETYQLGRYGEIVLSEGPQYQPTQIYDAQTEAAEIDALQASNAANRIIIDDGVSAQNQTSFAYIPNASAGDNGNGILDAADDFAQGGTLRIGAELTAPVTGVMSYANGDYKVIPTEVLQIDQSTNEGARQATPDDVGGDLRVVSFNTLNFFTTLNERGATSPEDLLRQTDKLVTALATIDGDIIGLQELENNGFGDGSAIDTLVDALNDRVGAGTYAFVDPYGDGSIIGTDAITTGLIYKVDAVTVTGSGVLTYDDGGTQLNRPTVAASFMDADGGQVTVAVNHFKSKGGTGTGDNVDSGDGQGAFNAARVAAAQQLTAWLASDPFGTGDTDSLVIGDLNAYNQEDPVQAVEAAGYVNLLETLIGAEEAFSYTFDGQRGALDQALASDSLASQVTGITEWHINSPEPNLLSYSSRFTDARFFNADDPYSASDHDPLVIGLDLTPDAFVIG